MLVRPRSRDQIDNSHILALVASVSSLVTTYKQDNSGFFSAFSSNNLPAVEQFATQVTAIRDKALGKSTDKPVTPFVNYVALLVAIYGVLQKLDAKKDQKIILELRKLLIDELRQQEEADFVQSDRESRYHTEDMDELLKYSLDRLREAAEYDSQEHLRFAKKFKLYGREKPEDLPLLHMLIDTSEYSTFTVQVKKEKTADKKEEGSDAVKDERVGKKEVEIETRTVERLDKEFYINQFDRGYFGKIISTLKMRVGLKSLTVVQGTFDSLNMKRNEATGMIDEIINEADKRIAVLEDEFKCSNAYKIEEPIRILVADIDRCRNNEIPVRLVQQLFKKVLKDEKEEDRHPLLLQDYPAIVDKLEDLKYWIKFPETNSHEAVINDHSQAAELRKINDALVKKIRIKNLRKLVNDCRLFPDDVQKRADLVSAILAKENSDFFGFDWYQKIKDIVYQIGVLTVDNLLTLCSDYMRHYVRVYYNYSIYLQPHGELSLAERREIDDIEKPILTPQEQLEHIINQFLMPMIKEVVNPALTVACENTISVSSYQLDRLRYELQTIIKECERVKRPYKSSAVVVAVQTDKSMEASPVVVEQRSDGVSSESSGNHGDLPTSTAAILKKVSSSTGDNSDDANRLKTQSDVIRGSSAVPVQGDVSPGRDPNNAGDSDLAELVGKLRTILPRARISVEILKENKSLRLALMAAYAYYVAELGMKHGSHGKEATLLFIQNLLALNPASHEQVQCEALKFIKGKGDYGTWYGGASGYHCHSRISYLLDSTLFDDRQEVIVGVLTVRMSKSFFLHQRKFSDYSSDSRKELTASVKALSDATPTLARV